MRTRLLSIARGLRKPHTATRCRSSAAVSAIALLPALMISVDGRVALAQDNTSGSRGPHFLLASRDASAAPRPLDVVRTPALQQRIALDLRGASVGEALDA